MNVNTCLNLNIYFYYLPCKTPCKGSVPGFNQVGTLGTNQEMKDDMPVKVKRCRY